jgi:hypothetical protein
MSKREPRFNLDPETGEMVEIDEELDAAIREAAASLDRGEGIPFDVMLKRLKKRHLFRSESVQQLKGS